mmetsp:Transcript_12198/g.13088  ORF Transcript_12198/g.13088 Transcript_12198/m.13088 type:complete len:207 (+) Transcript_12198:114-734(+)
MRSLQFVLSVLCIASSYIQYGSAFSSHSRVFVSTPTKANFRLVRDCMTPNPITLKTTDTIDKAITILLTGGFNGAPVVDAITNNLVGCVSAFDFIQKEETGAVLPFDIEDPVEQQQMMVAAQKIVATTVGELMTDSAITVTLDSSMREAAELLTKVKKHRLCVVDDDNTLVGIISTSDIMRNIVDVLQALPEKSSAEPTKEEALSE